MSVQNAGIASESASATVKLRRDIYSSGLTLVRTRSRTQICLLPRSIQENSQQNDLIVSPPTKPSPVREDTQLNISFITITSLPATYAPTAKLAMEMHWLLMSSSSSDAYTSMYHTIEPAHIVK